MPRPKKRFRIAHVAPLFASVPPIKYGGTERVLDWLINEQARQGHDVTLFASGDSKTAAKLVPVVPMALWRDETIEHYNTYHTIELDMVDRRAEEFDIIHCHFNFLHFQSLHRVNTPMVTTLHWRVDIKEFQDLYHYFNDAPLVAISRSQASYLPQANIVDVVHHGLPVQDYRFYKEPGEYIAFLGRFSPEKGADMAIKVALELEMPIKIAARMPERKIDHDYYNEKVRPLMDSELVEYVGEVDDKRKADMLGNALATLIPTSWPEPFGLVTIESLCCGTPVVCLPVGSTKEIVIDGEVGFTASSVDEMARAVKKIEKIDRGHCRRYIEKNFSSALMAEKYRKVYEKLVR